MHRRLFLASSAAAMGAAAQSRRIRIAFLGASHSHAADKVRITRASPDWELAGIWEPDSAVAANYGKAGVALLGREQILGDASI